MFATLAAGGLWALWGAHVAGWLPSHGLVFQGQAIHLLDRPAPIVVLLGFFTATLFITALMVSRIVDELGRPTAILLRLATRLESLYTMVCAIGAERRLAPVLAT